MSEFGEGEYEKYMRMAYEEARQGCVDENGCPIGAVMVDMKSNTIVGKGHNMLVQEGNPILHGEMSAMRSAGRMYSRRNVALFTSLSPCWMCTGTIYQFQVPLVIVGDLENAGSDETIKFLESKGVRVVVLDSAKSPAAKDCVELVKKFREEKPELWLEDWGGPRLGDQPQQE